MPVHLQNPPLLPLAPTHRHGRAPPSLRTPRQGGRLGAAEYRLFANRAQLHPFPTPFPAVPPVPLPPRRRRRTHLFGGNSSETPTSGIRLSSLQSATRQVDTLSLVEFTMSELSRFLALFPKIRTLNLEGLSTPGQPRPDLAVLRAGIETLTLLDDLTLTLDHGVSGDDGWPPYDTQTSAHPPPVRRLRLHHKDLQPSDFHLISMFAPTLQALDLSFTYPTPPSALRSPHRRHSLPSPLPPPSHQPHHHPRR